MKICAPIYSVLVELLTSATNSALFSIAFVDATLDEISSSFLRGLSNNSSEEIIFQLYTKRNPTSHQELKIDNGSIIYLNESNFQRKEPTVFVTHGWVSSSKAKSCSLIRDAYIQHTNANVIVIDWSKTANLFYTRAINYLEVVGKRIAEMINIMQSQDLLDVEKTTLIGHSLGAHVMGFAGNHAMGLIKTIYGLDPAGPMFKGVSPSRRISTDDAKYVQIIHSNGGILGLIEPVGHSDFYLNGGSLQPGCWRGPKDFVCNHVRAVECLAESINPRQKFRARLCADFRHMVKRRCVRTITLMGGIAPKALGIYYVATRSKPPYALG